MNAAMGGTDRRAVRNVDRKSAANPAIASQPGVP